MKELLEKISDVLKTHADDIECGIYVDHKLIIEVEAALKSMNAAAKGGEMIDILTPEKLNEIKNNGAKAGLFNFALADYSMAKETLAKTAGFLIQGDQELWLKSMQETREYFDRASKACFEFFNYVKFNEERAKSELGSSVPSDNK